MKYNLNNYKYGVDGDCYIISGPNLKNLLKYYNITDANYNQKNNTAIIYFTSQNALKLFSAINK